MSATVFGLVGGHRRSPVGWRVFCAAVAGAVASSLFVVAPGFAAPAAPATAAAAPATSVPVRSASARAASKAGSQTSPAWTAGAQAWPAGGDAVIAVNTGAAGAATARSALASSASGKAGGLGLAVRGSGGNPLNERALVHGAVTAAGPGSVRVSVADRATTDAAGVRGVLFTVVRADGAAGTGQVALDLDYAGFANAYGGDYGGRLRLVRLPSCVLTTPSLPQCRIQTPVSGVVNTTADQVLSAEAVDVGDGTRATTFAGKPASAATTPAAGAWGPSETDVRKHSGGAADARSTNGTPQTTAASMSDQPVYAMAASASSVSGSYAHTTLSQTATWGAGTQGGEFAYTVPLTMPAVSAGPTPKLTLAYSSNSVDGKTTSTNNQASWVGEGWDLQTGFIERSYRACTDDGGTTGDLCWFTDKVITMVLNGRSTRLIKDDNTGVWKPEADDGSKVELLINDVANGDYFKEYWKVTTQDGTQYYFGKHKRYTTDPDATNSVQKVLVYGNNAGEPCNVAGQPWNSGCDRAYRWNLDYVVDPAGNSMTYFYERYQGKYGNFNGANNWVYDLTSRLKRIDYGARAGSEGTSAPVARVNLVENPRCDPTSSGCSSYPDVPWDQYCPTTQTAPCSQYTPTYWTPWQLAMIYSEVYDAATSTYRQVDSYYLTKTFPSPLDGTAAALWFSALQHTGKAGGTGNDITLPTMTFTGEAKANRVNNGTSNHYRMTLVSTGTGEEVEVTYAPTECTAATVGTYSVDQNTHLCFPGDGSWFHKYVVAKVTDRDLINATEEVTSYTYSTAGSTVPALWRLDSNEAAPSHSYTDFAGYPTVTTKRGPTGGQQSITEKLYFRSLAGDKLTNGTERQVWVVDSTGTQTYDYGQIRGSVREERTYDGSTMTGKTLHSLRFAGPNGYDNPTATRTGTWSGAVPAKAYQTVEYETLTRTLLPGGTWRWTRQARDFDIYGLPVKVTDYADAGTAATADNAGKTADDTCTMISYAARTTARWMVSYPSQSITTDCAASPSGANYLSGSQTLYDGGAVGVAPTKGLVTSSNTLATVSGTTLTWAQAGRTDYDALGRVTGDYDALGHGTTTAYTPAGGGPVTSMTVTNALGHASTATIDPARGDVTRIVDANSKATVMQYDSLGRRTKVWLAGRATNLTPDLEYGYTLRNTAANAVSTKKLGPNGNVVTSYELYDGRLRLRQTQAPAPQAVGGRAITDTTYDARGLTAKTSSFWNNAAPADTIAAFNDTDVLNQHRYSYDNLERQTTDALYSANALKWQTSTLYQGDRTSVTPPAGGVTTQKVFDARGNTTELRQYTSTNLSGTYTSTGYTYDRLNRLTKVTDAAGNEWGTTYDVRGRVTQSTDPDKGATGFTYDAAGRMQTSTDARPVTLTYEYDNLDRKTAVYDGPNTSGFKRAKWVYDTIAKGQLTSSTRYVGTDSFTTTVTGYDDGYRALGSTTTIASSTANPGLPDGTYTTGTTYNVDGSVATVTYPAAGALTAETVTTTYDTTGHVLTVASPATTYVSSSSYYWFGAIYQQVLGSGTKQVRRTTSMDEATNRLVSNATETQNQTTSTNWDLKLKEQYGYDPAGNVKSINEVNAAGGTVANQCFTYNVQRQFAEAWTTASSTCQASPSTAVMGGTDPYWTTFTYDTTSANRTKEVRHTTAGTQTTRTYAYPSTGKRHTLTSVTATGDTTGTDSYLYDNAGNTRSRTISGKPAQTLTWDNEGHLGTVADSAGTTTYIYDADGNRLIAREPAGATVYLPGFEVRKAGGTVTCTRYYGTVASRTATGVTWLGTDHHNTGQVAVDAGTLATTRRKTDPFGNPRGADPTWPNSRGFVDGTRDGTGLTHLGAREYEPGTGRFISDDTVADYTDPQQINGYSYANGNPVTSSDPSGLWNDHDPKDTPAYEPPCTIYNTENCGPPNYGGGTPPKGGPSKPCTKASCDPCKNQGRNPTCATPGQLEVKAEQDAKVLRMKLGCLALFGVACAFLINPKMKSSYEQAWCYEVGMVKCKRGIGAMQEATAYADSLQNQGGWSGADANAVKHAYWMALMASDGFTASEAENLGVAHELGAIQSRTQEGEKGGNPNIDYGEGESDLDLHNNKVGFQVGASGKTGDELKAAVTATVYERGGASCMQAGICTYSWDAKH
ncbi:RHS repeat-associated core domain-containing protein [Dactylosporangium siamense]|uniref:DUF6973 domain-containing protein n=1 Tax=Dactylosporangium siamense TaxID=685454 RepID=A0A919U8Y3_9ACTN|nr:RHS repeat-associated core domain-containing protein [Dactylosporangium siamense]GIG47034.1 hypothetical protein Dsi01nite_050750 [Dactylosporangium siamense]